MQEADIRGLARGRHRRHPGFAPGVAVAARRQRLQGIHPHIHPLRPGGGRGPARPRGIDTHDETRLVAGAQSGLERADLRREEQPGPNGSRRAQGEDQEAPACLGTPEEIAAAVRVIGEQRPDQAMMRVRDPATVRVVQPIAGTAFQRVDHRLQHRDRRVAQQPHAGEKQRHAAPSATDRRMNPERRVKCHFARSTGKSSRLS